MANDVVINVKVKDSTTQGFASVIKSVENLGKQVGDSIEKSHQRVVRSAADAGEKAGRSLTDNISKVVEQNDVGTRMGKRVAESVSKGVEKEKQSLGKRIGGAISDGLSSVSDLFAKPLILAAVAASPAIAAVLAAAIPLALGGGVLVAGIIGAFQDAGVKEAASGLGETLKSTFSKATESFINPLKRSFDMIDRFVQGNGDEFKKMFDTMAPMVEPLVRGLLRLAEEALPGIQKGLEAAQPLFLTLAEKMPEIGEAVSQFFEILSDPETVEAAVAILTEIIDTITLLLPVLATAIGWLAQFSAAIREAFYWFLDGWSAILADARLALGSFWAWFTGGWRRALSSAASAVRSIGSAISGAFRGLVNGARNLWNSFWNWFISGWRRALSSAAGAVRSGGAAVTGAVRALGSAVRGVFASAGSWLYSAGRRIISGLVSGVRSMGGAIMSAVRSVIPDSIEGMLGFASGGIIGAASGGARSGMVMVGERGRELVKLPAGSQVMNNNQTEQMLAGGAGGKQDVTITLVVDENAFVRFFHKGQRSKQMQIFQTAIVSA